MKFAKLFWFLVVGLLIAWIFCRRMIDSSKLSDDRAFFLIFSLLTVFSQLLSYLLKELTPFKSVRTIVLAA